MRLALVWAGIAAYFFLFWFAVDLATAMIATFFLVMIGLRYTLVLMVQTSARQSRPDQSQPGVANRNHPPGR